MRPKYVLAVLALAAVIAGGAELRMGTVYGDARFAGEAAETVTNVNFYVRLPEGEWTGMTVCGWVRLAGTVSNSWLTTDALYCPEAIGRSHPDLAGGAFGWPGGMELTGAVAVAEFAWGSYRLGSAGSNAWPRGVYSLVGWSSNAVTVTLGGTDYNVGPGSFDRTALPGPSAGVEVTGTGLAAVAVCLTPCHQYFSEIDGVIDTESATLTAESIVTNEVSFCAWRIRMDGTNHVYRSDLTRLDRSVCLGQTKTNALPDACARLSSRGSYRFGLNGLKGPYAYRAEYFDLRVFTWWLEDEELCRVHGNGAEEIGRRGIPRWK